MPLYRTVFPSCAKVPAGLSFFKSLVPSSVFSILKSSESARFVFFSSNIPGNDLPATRAFLTAIIGLA